MCSCAVQEVHLLCLQAAADKSPAFPAQTLASCGRDINMLFFTSVLWNKLVISSWTNTKKTGKQTKTRLWSQRQGDCVVSLSHAERTSLSRLLQPLEMGGTPLLQSPSHPSHCLQGAPAGQMDRSGYFCPNLPLCLLIYLSEHTIETEPCIRGFVWLSTRWAHNLPHRALNANSICKSRVLRLSSAPRSAGLLQRQQAGGSLLRSALLSLIISWK